MLLGIKSGINRAYNLSDQEFKLIGAYLNGVSHSHFKKDATLFRWIGIRGVEDCFSFQDCLSDLQKAGFMTEQDVRRRKVLKYISKTVMTEGETLELCDISRILCETCPYEKDCNTEKCVSIEYRNEMLEKLLKANGFDDKIEEWKQIT